MDPIRIWHVVAANGVVTLVFLLLRRWCPRFSFGIVGLVLVILPGAFAFLVHKATLAEACGPVVGVLIVGADLTGRLPRQAQ